MILFRPGKGVIILLNWIIATAIVLTIFGSIMSFGSIVLWGLLAFAAIALIRWILSLREESPAGWRGLLY